MPQPRTEVAGVAWGSDIAVAGGLLADGGASGRADLYSVADNTWRSLPMLPAPVHHAALAVLEDRLYAVGGFVMADGQWKPSTNVLSLGRDDRAWRDEAPLPAGRGALAVVALAGQLIAAGGVLDDGATNTTAVFRGGVWRSGPPLARAREHLAATVANGRAYVIAGRVGSENLTDVESWDGADNAGWRAEPPLNDSRGGIGADTVDGRPCVAGGEEAAGTIASVECLRESRWERVDRLEQPRHGLAVVSVGGELHVIGGGRRPGLTVSATHESLDV